MYYVYLLKLEEKGGKNFYVGYTADLKERIKQHKRGDTRTTKSKKFDLVYYEAYNDKYLALKREKGLKSSGSVRMALMKRLNLK
jgi:putative endonuclease